MSTQVLAKATPLANMEATSWIDEARSGKVLPYYLGQSITSTTRADVLVNLRGNVAITFPRGVLERASPIFAAMLKFGSSRYSELDLTTEDPNVVYHVLFLLRDGASPRLTYEETTDVLYFAHKYALGQIIAFATQIIESPLTPDTCLPVYSRSQLRPRIGRGTVLRYASIALRDDDRVKTLTYDCLLDLISSDYLLMSESDVLRIVSAWGEANRDKLEELAQLDASTTTTSSSSSDAKVEDEEIYEPYSARAQSEYCRPLQTDVSEFGRLMKPLMKHVRICYLDLKDIIAYCDTKKLVSERDLLDLYASKGFALANVTPPENISASRFFAPRRKTTIDFSGETSEILEGSTEVPFAIIMESIPNLTGPLKLTKLYSMSNGANASTWHRQVDNKGPTVTIIRTDDAVLLMCFMGTWSSSNTYKAAPGSFMAAIARDGRQFAKYMPTNSSHVYDGSSYGPTFGSGHDCYTSSTMTINCSNSTYRQLAPFFDNIGFGTYFKNTTVTPKNIETWQIHQ